MGFDSDVIIQVKALKCSSRSCPIPPAPADPANHEDDGLEDEDDEEEILRRAQERVQTVRARKAAEAAKGKAEEEAARAAAVRKKALRAQRQEEEEAIGHCGNSKKLMVEISKGKSKGKGKAKAQAMGENANDGSDSDNDNYDEEEWAHCEQCKSKKIPCQMHTGKRSSVICKPCHNAKVRCSYSGRPLMVKKEGSSHPIGEHLAVLESQMAQLLALADNWQLQEGQVKANTYYCHFNRKLDWLMTDAARQRRSPPEMPATGLSELPRKRRRVVDSKEEEEEERDKEREEEEEVDEEKEGEEEEEGDELALEKARAEKKKEREE
ncbi:hypothetical protein F5879DRAFT_992755 [Lentinula edodes]|nr:hypothetical protein F5879DRAFT_992755 [Lentinula edodes]